MISVRTPVDQSALSFRVRRLLRVSGAAFAAAALCGCSITERLPELVDLESAGPAAPSLAVKAEADADAPPKDNRVIDVGFAPGDP